MKNTIIKATATLSVAIIGLSYTLLATEYWFVGVVGFLVGAGYLTAFMYVNAPHFAR